jgi:hypothetical protein
MSADLQRFAYEEGPPATGFRFRRILDVADDGATLLAATDQGVWRVGEDGRAVRLAPELIGGGIGAYAVARTDAGVWAGTERGVLGVDDAGDGLLVEAGVREPVYALLALADTVWLGGGEQGRAVIGHIQDAPEAEPGGRRPLLIREPL